MAKPDQNPIFFGKGEETDTSFLHLSFSWSQHFVNLADSQALKLQQRYKRKMFQFTLRNI